MITVGAALKKITLFLLTDKRALKTIAGITLGLVILIAMPVAAVLGVFSGDIRLDRGKLRQLVEENLTEEDRSRLQSIEDTMYAIEGAMTSAGFPGRTKEAQILYSLSLSPMASQEGFAQRLAGCFAEEQTDEQLIAAVSSAFDVQISTVDFSRIMGSLRAVYIDTSKYVDPYTKNNLDLVQWAKEARDAGWGYIWGTYGEVLTQNYYDAKAGQYPSEVGGYADFIKAHWIGRRVSDCCGLIKGYGWLDPDTHEIDYGTHGMQDVTANGMYAAAKEKGTIDTIPEIPGLAVWHEGHIGIYIGDGKVIEAMGTLYGVVETKLSPERWTHWLKVPYITYIDMPQEPLPGGQNEGGEAVWSGT